MNRRSTPQPSTPLSRMERGSLNSHQPSQREKIAYSRRRWLSRRALGITTITFVVLVSAIGVTLNRLGIVVPLPIVTTLAALPAPKTGAAYSRVAEDAGGDLWVAQSAPGLASSPTDATLLTIITPDRLSGDRVLARLCLGCASAPGPALARIDDIASDPRQPHALYVAGWTAPQKNTPSVPIVVGVAWQPDVAHCTPQACAIETTMLTPDTSIDFLGNPADRNTPLLRQLLRVGVAPVLTLASAHDGTLYCFLSDRGRDSLSDAQFNLVGGFQGLLRYDPLLDQWGEAYVGPGDRRTALHLSPTSTVTAMALDHSDRYLYIADADHHAIYRADLSDPLLGSASPYAAAGAFKQFAGQPITGDTYGDAFQAAPGWSGDGGPATKARLNAIRGLAFDAAGDLIISDAGNARLRLITSSGTIWTVAGRGVRTSDGDAGAPLAAGLGGMLGIAADTRGRVFLTDGAATDGTGHIRVRQLAWGWSNPSAVVVRSADGGHGLAGDAVAALVAANANEATATVVSASGCTMTPTGGCTRAYRVMAGGKLPDQAPLALPQPTTDHDAPLVFTPKAIASVPGTTDAVMIGDGSLGFVSTTSGASKSTVTFPVGATATGVAVLAPQTDAQLARLGAAYILVATQGGTNGPELLVYKATADTCGLGLQPPANCAAFPGTPALATTISLAGTTGTGAVAVTLSDDAHHAFALVAHPTDDAVSAVDLSPWLAGGKSPAPPTITRIAAPSPINALAIRHDGTAAYTGTRDGQLGVIDTTGWLTNGVPATLPNVAMVMLGATDATVASLALAGDDSRLFAALSLPSKGGQMIALDVGGFAQPIAPRVISTTATEAQPRALALVGSDARLLLVAAPEGDAHPAILRAWVTHDPANPTQWLAAPLNLGTVPTLGQPIGIVG